MGYTPEELQTLATKEYQERRMMASQELERRGINTHVTNQVASQKEPTPEDITDGMNVLEQMNFYSNDLKYNAYKGVMKAGLSAGKFVTDIFGMDDTKAYLEDAEKYLDDNIKAHSVLASGAEVVAQVGAGIVATGGIGGGIAINLGRGAVVEGVFFDEKSENIAGMLSDWDVKNDVIEYLKGDVNDSALEKRFKNALTGTAIGVSLEGIFKAFKYGRTAFANKIGKETFKGTDDELIKETIESVKEDAKKAYGNVQQSMPKVQDVTMSTAKVNQGEAIYAKANEMVNMKQGDELLDTKSPLNAERIASENVETLAKATQDVEGETLSRTHKETFKLADDELKAKLTDEQFSLMEDLTGTADKVKNLDLKVSQQRIVVGSMAKTLDDSIKIAQKEGGAEAMVAVVDNLSNLMKSAEVLKTTQKSIAQAMSSMRIDTKNSAMMNSLKMLDAIDPDYSIQALKNAIKTGDDEAISKLLDDIADPAKGVKDHVDNYKDSVVTKIGNVLSESVVASMLSAPSTLMVNILGNSLVKHQRALQDVAQFAWGFTGRGVDRMKARELRHLMYSNYGAVAKDVSTVTKNLGSWFKSGLKDETFDEAVLARYVQDQEFQHKYFSPEYIRGVDDKGVAIGGDSAMNKLLTISGRLSRTPYRAIGAVDDYYKRGAFRNELIREGSRLADQLKISDDMYDEFINKFQKANTELHMLRNNGKVPDSKWLKDNEQFIGSGDGVTKFADRARDNANKMTFQQELGDGVVGKTVDALNSSGYLRLLIPFKLTPINLLKYSGDIAFTPLRKQLYADIRAGGVKKDIALAKLSMSTTILGSIGYMATSGNMTGSFTKKERDSMRALGIPEYAVRVPNGLREKLKDNLSIDVNGNTWYEYKQVEPFATIGGIMTDLYKLQVGYDLRFQDLREDQKEDEMMALAGDIGMSVVNNIANKTYAKSLLETLNVFTGESSLVDYSGNLLSSAVPFSSLANFTGRTMGDGYKKEAKTFSEKIGSKYRVMLKRGALDAYGRKIKDVDYVKGVLIKEVTIDPVKNAGAMEVARLEIPLKKLPETLTIQGISVKLNEEEYHRMRRNMQTKYHLSDKLNRLVNTQAYKNGNKLVKTTMLTEQINVIKSVVQLEPWISPRMQKILDESKTIMIGQATRKESADKPSYNDMIIKGVE